MVSGESAELQSCADEHGFSDALLRTSLGVDTHAGESDASGMTEWLMAAAIVLAGAYLRVKLGPGVIGTISIAGAVPFLVVLIRSGLMHGEAAGEATERSDTIARVARHMTPLVLLAFPVCIAGADRWHALFEDPSRDVDMWLGAASYVLALLELIQLRLWRWQSGADARRP